MTARARRRVAVTGAGLVTPVGNDVATTWRALLEGRSGGGPIRLFDASGFSTRIAAEVKDFRNTLVTDRRLLKRHAVCGHVAHVACSARGSRNR